MPEPVLHFLGQTAAAPELVTGWCRSRWPERLPQGTIFCVPTSLSLRRLRDALTEAYGAFQGVRFLMPSALPTLFAPPPVAPTATPAEMLRVWDVVFDWLRGIDTEHAVAKWLFPGRRDWLVRPRARYAVARRLMGLRASLAECCLDFGAVAAHPATAALDARERGRWAALDALECKVREVLKEFGLEDPSDRQLAVFRSPVPQPQETGADWRLVMACVPDFMPALCELLRAAPACDILVQAEPEQINRFDAFGLPRPEAWDGVSLRLPDEAIVSAETPSDEATAIDRWLDRFGSVDPADLCLGVMDREVMPSLTALLARHGVEVFAPEPIALADRPPARALRALMSLATEGRSEGLLPFMCQPGVPEAVGTDYATLRAAFSELWEEHRPQTLQDAADYAGDGPLKTFVERCCAWVSAFRADTVKGTRAFLTEVYGREVVVPMQDPLHFATFEALHDLLAELSALRIGQGKVSPELLGARLTDVTLRPVRGDADCAYEGRMEILWSSAPILILAGLNEGLFPDTAFEDVFLPNGFRRALGLRNDRTRTARDAYLLETACALHSPEKTRLLCARSNVRGDWLKPSRLLFRCEAQEQANRAWRLFGEPTSRVSTTEMTSGLAFERNPVFWGTPKPLTEVSPSSLKSFLASPLEWWLSNALGLCETAETPPEGVPANLFGSLLHSALRCLRRAPGKTAEELTPLLLETFDRAFAARYGSAPDVELLAVRESAYHRLRAMARLEANLRAEGWETRYSEEETQGWCYPLVVDGRTVKLVGRIDRVDYHRATKVWRVIDYKTGGAGKSPNATHYVCRRGSDEITWLDFQLPIYRLLLRQALRLSPEDRIELAYITLPAEGQAAVMTFADPGEGERGTEAALRATIAQMLTVGAAPLPAEIGPYGNPLLTQLVGPMVPDEAGQRDDEP